MHRSYVLCALTLLTACSDRLTAPEAEAIVLGLEHPLLKGELRDGVLRRMGWAWGIAKLKGASQVTVSQGGRRLTYNAVVFERVMVPLTGSGRSPCLGPRWSLHLWRQGGHPEALSVRGGRFDQPFSPGRMCGDVNFIDPAPSAMWYPNEVGNAWASGSGMGDIRPGVDDGSCEFLSAADLEVLHRDMGITCRMTRHWVHFDASLHPTLDGTCGGTLCLGPGTMRIQLPPVEVRGVRYTFDCSLPQTKSKNLCGEG